MARSLRLGGRLPNCIIANPTKRRFILLRVNGRPLDLPENWQIWTDSLHELKHGAFTQITTESEALKLLPKEIVQLRV